MCLIRRMGLPGLMRTQDTRLGGSRLQLAEYPAAVPVVPVGPFGPRHALLWVLLGQELRPVTRSGALGASVVLDSEGLGAHGCWGCCFRSRD